jgi:hypothetical protein
MVQTAATFEAESPQHHHQIRRKGGASSLIIHKTQLISGLG